ncbi:RDD family protein [Pseudonocardia nigra]|uniref:RDD family protein n=1 Tax=Pseudonocardia nigra TaxID=1921578 RepID=UPI001C601151|nr:RDD family protein [Pseudonocardia nigra]
MTGPDPDLGSNRPDGASVPEPARYAPERHGPLPGTYGQRVGGHLIDVGIPLGLLALVLLAAPAAGAIEVVVVAYAAASATVVVYVLWNTGYRQGSTGQSLGKQALGVRLVAAATGQPVGFGRAVGRQLAHVLDLAPLGLGFLWPLWDERHQTFADKLCATLVVQTDV